MLMMNQWLMRYLLFLQVQARAQSPNTMPELKVDTKDRDDCVKEKSWQTKRLEVFFPVQFYKKIYMHSGFEVLF